MRSAGLVLVLIVVACSDAKYAVEDLQDPATCNECHPKHYQQWSGSMHAYASEDPVFLAMNARGQRDTNGDLGDFCINCHAPMAVAMGIATGASFDPAALPPSAKGITCYFCHNVEEITRDHNNGLVLAMDQTMRGGVKNAVDSPAHHSSYDTLMAGRKNNSEMCGSCHDVVTGAGVHIERTFAEWKETIFAGPDPTPDSFQHQTCASCHMFPSTEPIADKPGLDVGNRQSGFHEHTLGGIDQALTPFPEIDEQARVVQRDLDAALTITGLRPLGSMATYGGICVEPGGGDLTVRLDTLNVGHMFPSGAAQDRRAWVEVKAYNAGGDLVFSSGVVADDEDPEDIGDQYIDCTLPGRESCSGFWDRTFKADGSPAHFFWEVATVDSKLLKPQTILDPNATGYDHSTTVRYSVGSLSQQFDRIEAKLKIRPLPLHVLKDLIASGDLDPAILGQVKTLESRGATSVWTKATAGTGLAKGTGIAGQSGCNPF